MKVRHNVRARYLGALLLAASALGCDADGGRGDERDGAIELDGADGLSLSMPPLLATRAVNEEALRARVRINGVTLDVTRSGGRWRASAFAPEGADVEISIVWFERIGVRELALARFDASIAAIDRDRPLLVLAEDYDVDRYDIDGDGISNLAERIANTDPFDGDDPGPGFAQVFLPAIDPRDAPVIDGGFDAIWNEAQFRDRDRRTLAIDNLMIDRGATRLDGATGYRWAGMHDGRYLYLYVFGEAAPDQTPFGDSPFEWNDDALEIFWDGDDSKLSEYDGVDDFQLIVPLLELGGDAPNASASPTSRRFVGFDSAPLADDAVTFATCPCPGEAQTWELRIELMAAKIPVDAPIGFELQLDDDNDGGERDVKWGWFHPSRVNRDVDNTNENPSYMGTIRLDPADL